MGRRAPDLPQGQRREWEFRGFFARPRNAGTSTAYSKTPAWFVRSGDLMLDELQQQSLVTRLNRIEGQVRGIRRMVQEPRLCVDILQQLAAAEAALNRISLAVLRFHVEKCVPDGVAKGEPEKSKRLSELVDIFDRFAK